MNRPIIITVLLCVFMFFSMVTANATPEITIEMAQGEFSYHGAAYNAGLEYRVVNNMPIPCSGILFCVLYANGEIISVKTKELSLGQYAIQGSGFNLYGNRIINNPSSAQIKLFVLEDMESIRPISNVKLANLTMYVFK